MLLTASVECGKYFKADRGTLTLADGQLRFESGDRCLFDVALSSVQKMVWHWYSFGGAFEATIADQKYFLSFVPRGSGMDEWYAGMSTARHWRAALEGKPAPDRPPGGARILVVFFRIAQILILGCFTLLSLGVAIDPGATTVSRILGGGGAAAAGVGVVVSIYQGVRAMVVGLRGSGLSRKR